jgi:ergothioneine biosynthesis protein EgtB
MWNDKSVVVPIRGNILQRRFRDVRTLSGALIAGLSDADASAQSMPDASPAKWHLASTTWFFENFVLRKFVPDYREFDPGLSFLLNEETGARLPRSSRGLLTRPALERILDYGAHVDAAMDRAIDRISPEAQALVELGCNHEERHQELITTDTLHLFSQNPLGSAAWNMPGARESVAAPPLVWTSGRHGAVEVGASGVAFAFEYERPRHTQWLETHRLANRLVTNGEWLLFMDAGGYEDVRLWLPDGWAWVRANRIEAPLYWRRDQSGDWGRQFGLGGSSEFNIGAPVRNISYFEADAFARWAGARLPTEIEWESAAEELDPSAGTFLDKAEAVEPQPAPDRPGPTQMFGDLWEWTQSAFQAYPLFRPMMEIGEYNGKFMSGRHVLKGGSCATPRGHMRASYRNSLLPHQRWQFTGLRLARDD